MFRLARRKSRSAPALPVDVSTTQEPGVCTVEGTDVDTAADSRFRAMIAQLDTALADLSRTCDRIEQAVAGSSRQGWDTGTTDVTTVEHTASTARLAA